MRKRTERKKGLRQKRSLQFPPVCGSLFARPVFSGTFCLHRFLLFLHLCQFFRELVFIVFLSLFLHFFLFFKFQHFSMRLHQLAGGSTGPGYSLLCFRPKENIFNQPNNLAFIWDKCCHLTTCLHLMEPHCRIIFLVAIICQSCKAGGPNFSSTFSQQMALDTSTDCFLDLFNSHHRSSQLYLSISFMSAGK